MSLVSRRKLTDNHAHDHQADNRRLVDDITHRAAANSANSGTLTAILGPFWRADTPIRPNGTTISFETPKDGIVSYLHGTITCAETGKPIPNASVDVWQASTNGRFNTHRVADQRSTKF